MAFVIVLCLMFIKCYDAVILSPMDPSSYSRPDLTLVRHVSLDWTVDFDNRIIAGSALLNFDVLQNVNEVILDTNNVTILSIERDGALLNFTNDDYVPRFGSKLTIKLNDEAKSGNKLKIKINYSTSDMAPALNWLDPDQTSGKKYPFLFSQCLPIRARSILPCQDTPGVKFTYDAKIRAPEHFTVLMSALRSRIEGNTTYLTQPVPLPAYLLTIVVGVLESRDLGPRSKVWVEKDLIQRSAWEFAKTEEYLQAAENYCGPYEWSQYDLLVMPPSFAYGGMENPCLTYVTPSLLAGDRSLANVIVHEIIHSWTGNLVSIKNFEHFWMKEGFTVFLERKIGTSINVNPDEAMKDRDFESLLGLEDLVETVNTELGTDSPYTRLVLNLTGVHFDDTYSRVPYEKGSLFLRYLEDLLGVDEFDGFVRAFIVKFRRMSIDTDQLKSFMLEYFKNNDNTSTIDWDTWFYGTGMPPVIPNYDDSFAKAVDNLVENLCENNITIDKKDIQYFNPRQMIYLMQKLIDRTPLPLHRLRKIGEVYEVDRSGNAEIKLRWIRLCIRSKDTYILKNAFEFASENGRMKYLRPLYRDLYAWEDVRQEAINSFLKNEKYMMQVTANAVRKDLHLTA